MQGLLADVNVQGHLMYLRRLIESLELWPVVEELGLRLAVFTDLGLSRHLEDHPLWNSCQYNGWVLWTENRNHDGPDSLQATIIDSCRDTHLPVLTLSNKGQFEHNRSYAERVARDVAEILFGIVTAGDYLGAGRIFLPLPENT